MRTRNNVCPNKPLSKDRFQLLLAQGWGRVWPRLGKADMAAAMELTSTKTIDRAVTASNLPEAHTVLNSLVADPTALDEVFHELGFCLRPLTAEAANDMDTAAKLSFAAGAMIEALADGVRDHRETLAMADIFRPLIQSMGAIVSEADSLRAVSA
jgi:hypothetical protein